MSRTLSVSLYRLKGHLTVYAFAHEAVVGLTNTQSSAGLKGNAVRIPLPP